MKVSPVFFFYELEYLVAMCQIMHQGTKSSDLWKIRVNKMYNYSYVQYCTVYSNIAVDLDQDVHV